MCFFRSFLFWQISGPPAAPPMPKMSQTQSLVITSKDFPKLKKKGTSAAADSRGAEQRGLKNLFFLPSYFRILDLWGLQNFVFFGSLTTLGRNVARGSRKSWTFCSNLQLCSPSELGVGAFHVRHLAHKAQSVAFRFFHFNVFYFHVMKTYENTMFFLAQKHWNMSILERKRCGMVLKIVRLAHSSCGVW